MRVIARVVAAAVAVTLAVPVVAAAQGRGNGRPKQPRDTAEAATSAGGRPAPAPRTTAPFPQFGSWLDDASTPGARAGYTGIGVGYWRGTGASLLDLPILGLTYGVTSRAQLSATVPFYRVSYLGATARGLDDVYLSGKFAVIDPAETGRFGLAVGTVVELLSAARGEARLHWALPVSLEARGAAVRAYGSAGYFSRGAAFTAGALEWTTPGRTSITGSVSLSVSLDDASGGVDSPGEQLLDLAFYVAHPVATGMSVYAGAGRTFTGTRVEDSTTVSGGVSFRFSAARP